MKKATKSFKVLIDTGKDFEEAMNQVLAVGKPHGIPVKHISYGDAIGELWQSITLTNANPELTQHQKLSQTIQILHEISMTYAQFFDQLSEAFPDIAEKFFEEEYLNRDIVH